MDLNPEAGIGKLFEVSVTLGVLGVIAWLLWKAYSDGNSARITEIKENNKLLADAFGKETDAKFALAQATNKQTEVLESIVDRLTEVEKTLEVIKAK